MLDYSIRSAVLSMLCYAMLYACSAMLCSIFVALLIRWLIRSYNLAMACMVAMLIGLCRVFNYVGFIYMPGCLYDRLEAMPVYWLIGWL